MTTTERYCPACGAYNTPEAKKCFACAASLDTSAQDIDQDISTAHILQNRYRLLAQIGSGGFSAVYKAEDQRTRHVVAVKAVSLRGLSVQEKIEATDAFNREVTILNAVTHRNLPRIHDHFTDPECWYLVMDFIDGISLEHFLEDKGTGRLPIDEVLDLGILVCDVLDYLHSRQPPIIFRDLKPANIMLTREGHLFLIDFGIARRFKPGQAHDTIPFGSPGYAAPEQYGKTQTTPRADIYSLGAILHQLLTGNDPSQSAFSFAPLPDHGPAMQHLNTLISRMTDVDLNKRPTDIQEVHEELKQISKQQRNYGGGGLQSVVSMGQYRPRSSATTISMQMPPIISPAPPPVAFAYAPAGPQIQMVPPPPGPQAQAATLTQPNPYAIASLVSSLIGIFLPPFLCFASVSLSSLRFQASSTLIITFMILMLPSLLGIIFGHMGKKRAATIPSMAGTNDTAATGLIIGYIFGGLYLLLALCILLTNVSFFH